MLDFNVKDLSNEDLIKLHNDACRVLDARGYDAVNNLKIGSLVTYKQLDGSSHNYLIVDYEKDYSGDDPYYSLKAIHYYISPVGKITFLSTDTINEDYAATRLRLLDPLTTVTETDLKEGDYKDRLDALHMEIIEEYTTFSVRDEWR